MKTKPIYVEAAIRTSMEMLWQFTQTPELHQQWDLRFSEIRYIPRSGASEPQHFLYSTRIGFGVDISGKGQTVGEWNNENGERMSVLQFWSDHPLSLIEEGSGFWKYVPVDGYIRFFTRYDYKTRFGLLGRMMDQWLFRPLMGWATAWSFDCLRLWLEREIPPAVSLFRSAVHTASLFLLSFIWVYQGLIPKLIFQNSAEKQMISAITLFQGHETLVLHAVGLLEIVIGITIVLLHKRKIVYIWNVILLVALMAGAGITEPSVLVAPFNPVTLNLSMIGLSFIGMLTLRDLPSAGNCLRKPSQ